MGATSYEQGFDMAATLFEKVAEGIRSIQTKQQLREVLDRSEPLSPREQIVLGYALRNFPGLMRLAVSRLAKAVAGDLPALSGGRPPALTVEEQQEALDFITDLHRQGVSLEDAKKRAARKYGISLRTVERLWSDRASGGQHPPGVQDIVDVLSAERHGRP